MEGLRQRHQPSSATLLLSCSSDALKGREPACPMLNSVGALMLPLHKLPQVPSWLAFTLLRSSEHLPLLTAASWQGPCWVRTLHFPCP